MLVAIAAALIFLSTSAGATDLSKTHFLVRDYKGKLEGANGTNMLYTGEAVTLLKSVGDLHLVGRLGMPPNYEFMSEQQISARRRPTWVPASALAHPSAFKRIASWEGPRTAVSCNGSCDSGTVYTLSPNGTFVAEYGAANKHDDPRVKRWHGQIYTHGVLVWPRTLPSSDEITIFVLSPSGELADTSDSTCE